MHAKKQNTHTQSFKGLFSRTTLVGRYQKNKPKKTQNTSNIKIYNRPTHNTLTLVWWAPTTSCLEPERVYSGKAKRQTKETNKKGKLT